MEKVKTKAQRLWSKGWEQSRGRVFGWMWAEPVDNEVCRGEKLWIEDTIKAVSAWWPSLAGAAPPLACGKEQTWDKQVLVYKSVLSTLFRCDQCLYRIYWVHIRHSLYAEYIVTLAVGCAVCLEHLPLRSPVEGPSLLLQGQRHVRKACGFHFPVKQLASLRKRSGRGGVQETLSMLVGRGGSGQLNNFHSWWGRLRYGW